MAAVRLNPKFRPLTQPYRFKVMYGGRGGGKSWAAALVLVSHANKQRIKVVCARAFQNSIAESSKELVEACIRKLGLEYRFKITEKEIINVVTKSRFIFIGIERNPGAVKSLEGCDICWVEEANQVGRKALDMLIPTIRKNKSEIWFTFNPEIEEDPVYKDFVTNTPDNCVLIKINYTDNPDCPQVLIDEANRCKMLSEARYRHIWLGEPGWPDEALYSADDFPVVDDPQYDVVFVTADTAMVGKPDADGTGICIWGATYGPDHTRTLTLLDWDKRQVDGRLLGDMVKPFIRSAQSYAQQRMADGYDCEYKGIWIEAKGSGIMLLQSLEAENVMCFPLDGRHWGQRAKGDRAIGTSTIIKNQQVQFSRHAAEKMVNFKGSNENHFYRELKSFRTAIREQEDDLIDNLNYAVILVWELGDNDK